MSQDARKPMFDLTYADGAIGSHAQLVQTCANEFKNLAKVIAKAASLEFPRPASSRSLTDSNHPAEPFCFRRCAILDTSPRPPVLSAYFLEGAPLAAPMHNPKSKIQNDSMAR